ncbi:L-lactate permease [Lactobacillus psittaci]|nr:L-lactate permease [Lactobacillus psittaci]
MWVKFILALIPIIWLIISLGVLKLAAIKATVIGLLITIFLAIFTFKLSPINTLAGAIEGVLMGLFPIVYVIIAALFTYNVTNQSGAIKVIQDLLSSITTDKRILVLIIAWGFGGFLEAIAGFGTAVAIPAGILIAFGIEPIKASVICLVANTTPTAFGAIGLPVITLADVTQLDKITLSTVITFELLPLIVIIPFILVCLEEGSIKAINGVFAITLVSGLAFALPQIVVAHFVGPELPAIVGAIMSIGLTVLMAKIRKQDTEAGQASIEKHSLNEVLRAVSPFILVFSFVLLVSPLFSLINKFLNQFLISFPIGNSTFKFAYLSSPGTLIILATFIGGLIQKVKLGELGKILVNTIKGIGKTAITICAIVGLAKVMGYAGMTSSLAVTFVALMGPFYPLVAPLIGAIGTFVTGSDTSANVLFGNLQLSAAQTLGDNTIWVCGSNMVGATAGKMISPQSIAVATAATGLEGKEGEILKEALKWCGLYLVLICSYLYLIGLFLGMLHL